jgi:serine/threonine protein kinase/tetratricopeptide (TPR) repeat protein
LRETVPGTAVLETAGGSVIGRRVSHYTILENLGCGGMGIVYKAVDDRLGRTVALKFLSPQLLHDPESRERFLREARVASSLEHPHICAIHEVDETPEGHVFICMSCYEGQPLSALTRAGPMEATEALKVAIQVVDGLAYAHGAGVIHRDVKPANIMLTTSGTAKIMDFGLARLEGQARLTRTGTTPGTAAYMAPEQILGETVDARADIWAVGVMLFEMVTGRLPFEGEYEASMAYAIVNETPPGVRRFNPGVPAELEMIIRRCLARRPEDRYATATELLVALRHVWQTISPAAVIPIPAPARQGHFGSSRWRVWIPWAAGIAIAVASLLVIPGLRNAFQVTPSPPPLPAPRRLAVLPFQSTSADIASRSMAEGFRVFITDRLALAEGDRDGNWAISPRILNAHGITSAEEARRQENVNLVMTGKLSLEGMKARLILAIRGPQSGPILRERRLADNLSSLTTFQRDLTDQVLGMLEWKPSPAALARLSAGGTALPGAFRQYIQGLGALELQDEPGNLDMALSLFRGAVANDPMYADGWAGVASACYDKSFAEPAAKNGMLVEAADAARHSLKIAEMPATHRLLACILETNGQPEAAESEYRLALRSFPGYYDAECDLAWFYQDQNRMREAELHFLAASRLRPDYWLTYNYLGTFYNSLARYAEAVKMFTQAIQQAPDNVSPYGNLAATYFRDGKLEKSRESIQQALALKPNAVTLSNWATIYAHGGAYRDAAGLYERALAAGSQPYEYVIWGNLAECYRQLADLEKARQAFEKAIRLGQEKLAVNPENPEVLSRLALYHAMSGRGPDAVREIQAARKRAPADVDVLVRTIRVYELAGRRDAAIQSVEELLDRSPSLKILESDPDLVNLRKDPRYLRIAGQANG